MALRQALFEARQRQEQERQEQELREQSLQREERADETERLGGRCLRLLTTMLCCGGREKMSVEPKTLLQDTSSSSNQKKTGAGQKAAAPGHKLVLGRYDVVEGKAGVLGEGSFSVVQKAVCRQTGKAVAVKTYKLTDGKYDKDDWESCLLKFKRQIQVMGMLMEPVNTKAQLIHPCLLKIDPRKCFIELLDYSKDAKGNPGPDPTDGKLYVVTEVADYSLKDYLGQASEERKDLGPETVRQIARSFVVSMAMLHVKGLAHLDMKPENIMRAGATWKVIDVDGCTPLGKAISINDSSISFSPCYCAPEWAHFLIEDGDFLKVGHQLDVWSVGISLCELIALDAVLKPKYVSIYRSAGSHRKAGFLFLEWLANPKEQLVMDEKVGNFDPDFKNMVLDRMLVKEATQRISLSEVLDCRYIKDCIVPGLDTNTKGTEDAEKDEKIKKHRRERGLEEVTDKPPLIKGVLYKLNSDGEKSNPEHWLRRDMWLAHNGNLCYYSQKKNKRLVLLDLKHLALAKLSKVEGACAHDHVFCVDFVEDEDAMDDDAKALQDTVHELQYYAAESAGELEKWLSMLNKVVEQPDKYANLDTKMLVSAGLIQDFRDYKMLIRNRREKIDRSSHQYQPVFEKELWKLNSDGDPLHEDDWTFRNMWLAKNGAFCYFSKKENKELMYYRPDDIRHVRYRKLHYPTESCRPFSFELTLRPSEGMEYAPGVFAAGDEGVMMIILGCIEKYQKIKRNQSSSGTSS
ncbi:unnamed protein product [Amoebophrya sp. A25]|nr:unnamed protein product [Amoebophrya sp. A25]|eukprot:GSA25T00020964001.1